MNMIITEYNNFKDKIPKIRNYSWEDFCKWVSHPAGKYGITWNEYNSLPKDFEKAEEALGRKAEWYENRQGIKQHCGGAVYGEIHIPEGAEIARKQEYFKERCAISLDYEECDDGIFDRINTSLSGYSYVWYTTCNHHPPDNRVRIVIPFSKPIDWKHFCLITVIFANKIGLDGIDKSCIQPYRMMLYTVQIKEDKDNWKEYKYGFNTAEFLNVEDYFLKEYGSLDLKEIYQKADIKLEGWKISSKFKKECRMKEDYKPVKIGNKIVNFDDTHEFRPNKAIAGDVKSCFNAVFSVSEIMDKFIDEYEKDGDRYTYKLGHGSRGIQVYDDDTWLYSHHESGPLANGHRWTAFDLYLYHLEHHKNIKNFMMKNTMAHKYAGQEKGEKYEKLFYGKFYRR